MCNVVLVSVLAQRVGVVRPLRRRGGRVSDAGGGPRSGQNTPTYEGAAITRRRPKKGAITRRRPANGRKRDGNGGRGQYEGQVRTVLAQRKSPPWAASGEEMVVPCG
ncbi:hypothetical protein GCM10027203_77340 [Nonomuraea fastidiosa]